MVYKLLQHLLEADVFLKPRDIVEGEHAVPSNGSCMLSKTLFTNVAFHRCRQLEEAA